MPFAVLSSNMFLIIFVWLSLKLTHFPKRHRLQSPWSDFNYFVLKCQLLQILFHPIVLCPSSISTWLAAVQSHKPVSLSKIINEMVKKSPNLGCDFLYVSMFEGLEMVKMFIEMSFYFALDTLNGSSTFLVVKMFLKH